MIGVLPTVPLWFFVASAGVSALFGSAISARVYDVKLKLPELVLAIVVPTLLTFSFADHPVEAEKVFWTIALIFSVTILSICQTAERELPFAWIAAMIGLGLISSGRNGADWSSISIAVLSIVTIAWLLGMRRNGRTGMQPIMLIAAALAWHGYAVIPDLAVLAGGALLLVRIAYELIDPVAPTCIPIPKADRSLPLAPALGFAQLTIWLGGPIL